MHKMIVATRRRDREKIAKDIGQSTFLIDALQHLNGLELASAWVEAWQRGPKWQEALSSALGMLPETTAGNLKFAIERHAAKFTIEPTAVGL